MNCLITIKGDGKGRYGHPKTDKTGPVSRFLVDNVYFYTEVRKHLKGCQVCNPVDILQVYFNRRLRMQKNPKKPWLAEFPVSVSALSNAMVYGRQWPKTLPVVKQFLLHAFKPIEFLDHIEWFDNSQILDYFVRWQKYLVMNHIGAFPTGPYQKYKILLDIPNLESFDPNELPSLMDVAEIIHS